VNKFSLTAKRLNTFFRILNIGLSVAAVACLVGLGILAVGAIFNLAPEQVATGYDLIDLGFIEFRLAESVMPDEHLTQLNAGIVVALSFVCIIIGKLGVGCIRKILEPMEQGAPFHSTVSANLKKLALLSVILGVLTGAIEQLYCMLQVRSCNLAELLLSENILHVTFHYTFDLDFLIIGAVLLLLSYVFRYGEELQQLSDETL